MNYLKKVFLCLLTLFIVVSLVGCDTFMKKNEEDKTDSSSEVQTTEKRPAENEDFSDVIVTETPSDSTEPPQGDDTVTTESDIQLGDENKEWESFYPIP